MNRYASISDSSVPSRPRNTIDEGIKKPISKYDAYKKGGSSGKWVLGGVAYKRIIGFMQYHGFQFEKFDISEARSRFVQGFDLILGAFQGSGPQAIEVEISEDAHGERPGFWRIVGAS